MSEVIERLLKVEEEARRVIAQAEKDAAETVERAHEQARQTLAQAREQARRESEELVGRETSALQEQKEQRIQQERGRLPSAAGVDQEKRDKAVEFVVRVVACGEDAAQ